MSNLVRLQYILSSVNTFFNAHAQPSNGTRCLFFVYFHTLCVRIAKALVRLGGCAGSGAGRLCDKYHNFMSCFKYRNFTKHYLKNNPESLNDKWTVLFLENCLSEFSLTSQSTTMVMPRWSDGEISAHPFASNWQLPLLESAVGREWP